MERKIYKLQCWRTTKYIFRPWTNHGVWLVDGWFGKRNKCAILMLSWFWLFWCYSYELANHLQTLWIINRIIKWENWKTHHFNKVYLETMTTTIDFFFVFLFICSVLVKHQARRHRGGLQCKKGNWNVSFGSFFARSNRLLTLNWSHGICNFCSTLLETTKFIIVLGHGVMAISQLLTVTLDF